MIDKTPAIAAGVAADLLRELRYASLKFCQSEVQAFSTRVKNSLLRESERAASPAQKTGLMETYRALLGQEAVFDAALMKALPLELDRAIASDAPPALLEEFAQTRSQLAIVEDQDVQREIRVFQLIRELDDMCADTASALTLRICHLRSLDTVEVRFNPFRPETFTIGLVAGWESFQGGRSLTHWLISGFRATDFFPLNALYAGLNKILIARGVMPKEQYIVHKKSAPVARPDALWVKSDVIGAGQVPETGAHGSQAFSPARFMQQLNLLSQQLSGGRTPGPRGPDPAGVGSAIAKGSVAHEAASAQPSPALLAAMDALLAQVQAHTADPAIADPGAQAATQAANLGLEPIRSLRAITDSTPLEDTDAGGNIDREVIEMVSRIFDFILEDASIPLQLKVLIADLQLPVLKAGLTDPSFFLSDQHPARRVVDLLARFGLYWEFLPSDEVAETVRKEVTRLREASRHGVGLFTETARELEAFLGRLEQRYEARLQSSLANVTKQEQRAEAMPEVDRSLEQWFEAGPVEDPLARFLRGPWRSVLCEYVVARAHDPAACEGAFGNTSLLIWSILPKTTPTEREHLLRQLPVLLGALNTGLDRIQMPSEEREPILKFLMERHAQAIRPGNSGVTGRVIPVPRISAPPTGAPVATVERWNAMQLSVGDWFILELGNAPAKRYRLSWTSPKCTKFVFTARDSSEALALNDDEVEERLRSGSLRLVDSSPIVRRAITASFEAREGQA